MHISIVLCFLTVLTAVSYGQDGGMIRGTTFYNGMPVSGAEVQLGTGRDFSKGPRTIADSAGKFTFAGLAPGTYSVRAWASVRGPRAGGSPQLYIDAESTVTITAGEIHALDLTLSETDITADLRIREQITISADTPQPVDEVSKTVNVITGQEMRDRADLTLVESLRSIPGIRVQQLGGFGRTASVRTRGLRNQDTAFLIDGIRFRDAASITGDATPFLSDVTLTSVSRVEVLRGSGSSLYGTNATGGVIDLQTPQPRRGWHGQVSAAGGGLGLKRIRGNTSFGTDEGGFGFVTGISRTIYSEGIDGNDDANNTNFQFRSDLSPTMKTGLSGRLFVSDAFVRLNSNPDTHGKLPTSNFGVIEASEGVNFVSDADDPDDFQSSNFVNAQIVLDQVLTNKLHLHGYYSVLKTSRGNETGPLGVGFQFGSFNRFAGTIQTAHIRTSWSPTGENTLTAGYEFEGERFENDSSSAFSELSTRATQRSNTVYIQHMAGMLDDRLQLAGGARWQFFDLRQPRFSAESPLQNVILKAPPSTGTYDASAAYFIRETQTKFRAHVGSGYRVPSLFERFSSFFGAFSPDRLFLAGAPDLEPETSVGFDAGFEQYFDGTKVKISGTYFYTRLNRAIGYGFLPQPDRFDRSNSETFGGYLNTEGFISRGAELSGSFSPFDSTDIFTSYTYTNSDQRRPQVTGSGVISTLGIPGHQFTLVVVQRISKLWVSLDFLGASAYLAPVFSSSTFGSYVYRFRVNRRADLTSGYTFAFDNERHTIRVFGTVENLFDYEYYENGFKTVGRNGRIGLSYAF